jgi:hypothetical protein
MRRRRRSQGHSQQLIPALASVDCAAAVVAARGPFKRAVEPGIEPVWTQLEFNGARCNGAADALICESYSRCLCRRAGWIIVRVPKMFLLPILRQQDDLAVVLAIPFVAGAAAYR